jgi:RNA polymerase sigma-70 factor (ECF subfamily)
MQPSDETMLLLQRWHAGEAEALARLVERDLPWIRDHVRRRLGPLLRQRDDTDDIFQLAMVQALEHGPRFVVPDQAHFRRLVASIVENVLRAEFDRHTAQRRDLRREAGLALGDTSAGGLRAVAATGTSPSRAVAADELQAMVRVALELLSTEERTLIVLREYEGLSFAAIGGRLGLPEKTVQRRFARALRALVAGMERLTGDDTAS